MAEAAEAAEAGDVGEEDEVILRGEDERIVEEAGVVVVVVGVVRAAVYVEKERVCFVRGEGGRVKEICVD